MMRQVISKMPLTREIIEKVGPYYQLGLKETCVICGNERFLGLLKDDNFICSNCAIDITIDVNRGE